MSQSKPELTDDPRADTTIIDSDFHNDPEFEDIEPYIEDETIKEAVERDGMPFRMSGWRPNYSRDGEGAALGQAVDQDDVIEAMNQMSTDAVVVNPNMGITMASARYEVVKTELIRAYNRYLVNDLANPEKNIYATLPVPQWDAEEAAREVRKHGDVNGIVAAQGWFSEERPVGYAEYDRLFEELVGHDLPLAMHVGGYRMSEDTQSFPEAFTVGNPAGAMMNAVSLVFSGTFDKFSDLQIVMQEGGTNWIPQLKFRGDDAYQMHPLDVRFTERMHEMDEQYLERQPSEYITEHFSFTTQPIALPKKPNQVKAMFEMCDARENFLFSSDWPHPTADTVDWVFQNAAIDEELRERILRENAESVFGIEL